MISCLCLAQTQVPVDECQSNVNITEYDNLNQTNCCAIYKQTNCYRLLCNESFANGTSGNFTSEFPLCSVYGQLLAKEENCSEIISKINCATKRDKSPDFDLKNKSLDVDLVVQNRAATPVITGDPDPSDDIVINHGYSMPVWLIVLLVILIIAGCIMVYVVCNLFKKDKDNKDSNAATRKSSKKHSKKSVS